MDLYVPATKNSHRDPNEPNKVNVQELLHLFEQKIICVNL